MVAGLKDKEALLLLFLKIDLILLFQIQVYIVGHPGYMILTRSLLEQLLEISCSPPGQCSWSDKVSSIWTHCLHRGSCPAYLVGGRLVVLECWEVVAVHWWWWYSRILLRHLYHFWGVVQ